MTSTTGQIGKIWRARELLLTRLHPRCANCAKLAAGTWAGESVVSDSYFDLLAKATHARRLMEHLKSPADLAAITEYAQELEAKAEALLRQEFTSISGAAWSDLQQQKQAEQDAADKK
jgi:hypothetical protein